jgi:CO/xanthine dehydrogenase FAD-binding subunit
MTAIAGDTRSIGIAPVRTGGGATFAQPTTLGGVFEALAAGARIVAGGTDLVVGTRQGKWTMPEHLVAIDRVEDLRGIRPTADGGLWLGALTTHDDLATSALIQQRFAALADAAAIVGSFATRHVGTIGGNIVNASPAAETVGPLVCFGAIAVIRSAGGERRVPVADVATGPGRTALQPGELVAAVEVPAPAAGTASCYARLEYRRQMEIAVVGATAVVTVANGRVGDAVVRERFTALTDASAIVGSHATRAQGTIGGNVMNASPAMETGGPLICLDATVTLRSADGTRSVAVGDLFTGPGATVAEPGELLVSVDVPAPPDVTGSAYVRLEYRRQMEIAVVGATAAVTLGGDTVTQARVAITALAPTIRRAPEAESSLKGTTGSDEDVAAAARAAAQASAPISDVRASERYRTAMAEVIARRAIGAALARARGREVPIPASTSAR